MTRHCSERLTNIQPDDACQKLTSRSTMTLNYFSCTVYVRPVCGYEIKVFAGKGCNKPRKNRWCRHVYRTAWSMGCQLGSRWWNGWVEFIQPAVIAVHLVGKVRFERFFTETCLNLNIILRMFRFLIQKLYKKYTFCNLMFTYRLDKLYDAESLANR